MDIIGIQAAIEKFNKETIPNLTRAVDDLVDKIDTKLDADTKVWVDSIDGIVDRVQVGLMDAVGQLRAESKNIIDSAHELLDRLDGATVEFHIPKRVVKGVVAQS